MWVEVWFPGVGWQAFDPTANVPLVGESAPTMAERLEDVALSRTIIVVMVVAAVLVMSLWALVRVRRRDASRRARTWAVKTTERLDRAGTRRGRPRCQPRQYRSTPTCRPPTPCTPVSFESEPP